ncbi:hypothetical protein CBR_g45306 [Chara braunii]|uniref:Piezo non-specific cation channel R-Ras-binding domain-containing protein n=1 Tax=Chara braunii TaxID=69332 RepID=A0A388LY54_CHABU|nr:hypothetical protein CBR_g45306 [Chara braunii]|eukprot:GBG87247.1 hypothetical protein CBR_g45306 [Chara braunii]
MRSFLGMTGYYRNFVENYSIVAAPLTDLTHLDTPWEWTERCEAAFRHLKHALTHYEVLKLPDPDKPFIVTTDASQYGIGIVLAQQEGKKLRPVEYMSKKMPSQKLAKSTYEKELYAVYKALTHWRHYLLGGFFILRTDHQTLRWMRTQPVLSDALKRWIEVIEQYDFEPQYIKGEYNKVADALSRRPDFSGALIIEFDLADIVTQSLVESYREDPFMSEIIRRLEAKDKATSVEFELVKGLLFLEKDGNKRLCVPNRESLRSLFLGECHDATGHFGYKKTAANLLQRFWWPTMMRDAQLYAETCQVCQRDKPRTQAPLGLLKPLPIPERPGESLSMDFMDTLVTSKSGMRHIFVIVDMLGYKSAMWLPIVLFATMVMMVRYVCGAFPDFKDLLQKQMNLDTKEMSAVGLNYEPGTPLYRQLWDSTLLLCIVQLHRIHRYGHRRSRRSLQHPKHDVSEYHSVSPEVVSDSSHGETVMGNGNHRSSGQSSSSDNDVRDREQADFGSEMGDINYGYLGFLKRLSIVHCHKPVAIAIFYASVSPVCAVGFLYLSLLIIFFNFGRFWAIRARIVVIYTAVVMAAQYFLQVAVAEDGMWSPEFEKKMKSKTLVMAACVFEHSCMWWRERLPSYLRGDPTVGDNCLLFIPALRRSRPVNIRTLGGHSTDDLDAVPVMSVPSDSANFIQVEGTDYNSGKRRKIGTEASCLTVVKVKETPQGEAKPTPEGTSRNPSFENRGDGRSRRWSKKVIQDIRQFRYQAQMDTLQRYVRYVVEHFFLLYGLEISMLTLLLAAFAVLNVFSVVYVGLLALCILLPRRHLQGLWSSFVFLFAAILVAEYVVLWRTGPSQGDAAKPCSACWFNKEPKDDQCWECWLGVSLDDPQMLWSYFLVYLISTYQLRANLTTAQYPNLILSPVAKLSDSMGWSKILFESRDQWTWLDHLRFLFYRNLLLVVLLLVSATGTLKYDVLHFGYLAFSLIFFHIRLTVMKKRNAVFSLLRLYNFFLIILSLGYQAPYFVYQPNGIINIIGLYKYKYGFRTELNLDFGGPCSATSKDCSRSAIVDITIFVLVAVQSWVFRSEVFEQVMEYIAAEQVEALAKAHEDKAEWKKKQLQQIRQMDERKQVRRSQVQKIKEWLDDVSNTAMTNAELSLTKYVDRGSHRIWGMGYRRHVPEDYLPHHPRIGASTPGAHLSDMENQLTASGLTAAGGGGEGTATRPFPTATQGQGRNEYALESAEMSSSRSNQNGMSVQSGGGRGEAWARVQSSAVLSPSGERYIHARQKGGIARQQAAARYMDESARAAGLMRVREAAANRGLNASSGGSVPHDILGSLGAHAIYDGVQLLGERFLANVVEFLNLEEEQEQDEKMEDHERRMYEEEGNLGSKLQDGQVGVKNSQADEIEEEARFTTGQVVGTKAQGVMKQDALNVGTRPEAVGLAKRPLPNNEDKSYMVVPLQPTETPEDSLRRLRILLGYIKGKILSNTDFVCYLLFVVTFVWNFSFLTLMYPATLFIYALQSNPGPTDAFWILVLVYTELNILMQYTYQVVSTHIPDFHPVSSITLELLGIHLTHSSFVISVLPLFLVYLCTLMHMSYRDGEWMKVVDQSDNEVGRKKKGTAGRQKRVRLNFFRSVYKALVTYWRSLVQGREAPPYFVQVSMFAQNVPQPESIESGMNRLLARSYQLAWNTVYALLLDGQHSAATIERKGVPSRVRVESIENSTDKPGIAVVAVLEVVHAAVLPGRKGVKREIWQDVSEGPVMGQSSNVDIEEVLTPSADVAHEIQKMVDEDIVEENGFPYPIFSVVTGQKQEADFHAYIVGIDLLTFIYVLLFYQLAVRDKSPFAEESYDFFEDQFPMDYVLVLLALFSLMVVDRTIYLCVFPTARVLYYFFTLILFTSYVMMMFWTAKMESAPVLKDEERGHSTVWLFRVFYFLKSLSLALSALQLKYGHPTNSVRCGQFLMRKVSRLNWIGFSIYRGLPFVFELRSVLDWACTTTSLPLYDWLKLEDIYASLFLVQCDLKLSRERHKLGERQEVTTKFCNGCCLFIIIVSIIWLPMLMFSTGNPVNVPNPVIDVKLTVSLYTDKGTFPLYQGGKRRLIKAGWKPPNDTWLHRFEKENIQLICCYPDSDTVWQLPRPVQNSLASFVNNNTTLQVLWEFIRELPLGKEMIMNDLEAATGEGLDEKIVGVLSGTLGAADFPALYPKYWRLPGIGKAKALEMAKDVKVGGVLSLEKEALPWWKFMRDNDSAEADCPENASGPVAVVVSDKVPGYFIGETISKMGITGLYVTFVMSVGRFLRLICSDLRMRIPYENFPSCDRLLAICEDIYAARAEGELELEEQLFWTFAKALHVNVAAAAPPQLCECSAEQGMWTWRCRRYLDMAVQEVVSGHGGAEGCIWTWRCRKMCLVTAVQKDVSEHSGAEGRIWT